VAQSGGSLKIEEDASPENVRAQAMETVGAFPWLQEALSFKKESEK
jgi:hypothetical protein